MQLTSNTTGMEAGLAVVADKHARDHCVVVVKGTFLAGASDEPRLSLEQQALVQTDEHHGDPATTSIRLESEFALEKPFTDVVVVGKAVAPTKEPVTTLRVRLEVEGRSKDAAVTGPRRWVRAMGGLVASPPVPFTELPLVYEHAFGGTDDSRGPTAVAAELRNLVGVGFHPHRDAKSIDGLPLPCIEHPAHLMSSVRDRPPPIGYGYVGRGWQPRVAHAGTYDQRWLDEVCPFLPADFDPRYHQGAPPDQWFPLFQGGEKIRCVHMARAPVVEYRIPRIRLPVRFRFADRNEEKHGRLDTVILEPDLGRMQLVWRASVPLGKKLVLLREIEVGERPFRETDHYLGARRGKPAFRGVEATLRWLRKLKARSAP
jgi:hypothetical protein